MTRVDINNDQKDKNLTTSRRTIITKKQDRNIRKKLTHNVNHTRKVKHNQERHISKKNNIVIRRSSNKKIDAI